MVDPFSFILCTYVNNDKDTFARLRDNLTGGNILGQLINIFRINTTGCASEKSVKFEH